MARANKPATPESSQAATPAGSDDIRARIASERERLAAEEARELQLMQDRLPPLEAGDDAALDAVERRIADSRTAQVRIQERIELLTSRLSDAEQRDERARVEALRDQAEKARQIGEREIREGYAVHAAALAKSLRRLRAIDGFIEHTNRSLEGSGLPAVGSPNNTRGQPSRSETVKRKRKVGLGEPEHPYYGLARPPMNPGTRGARPDEEWNPEITADNGDTTRVFVEIEEELKVHHTATWQSPLYEAIEELPSATQDEWPKFYNARDYDGRGDAALLAEMGITQDAGS